MIICFSGTGNSRHVAERIAEVTGDALISLNDLLKGSSSLPGEGALPEGRENDLVFVTPTYAWRIPRVVEEWISMEDFTGTPRVWFVMTCGGQIGGAPDFNRALAEKKNFTYMGTAGVVMPENYIAMFRAPAEEEARGIILRAEPVIADIAACIAEGKTLPETRLNLADRAMSAITPVFYRFFVNDKKYFATDSCVGCGLCEGQCPLNNIRLSEKKLPVWGGNCTQCMACICHCPTEAIEYGKASRGKVRYHIR